MSFEGNDDARWFSRHCFAMGLPLSAKWSGAGGIYLKYRDFINPSDHLNDIRSEDDVLLMVFV
jgi:hypothetical protein